MTLTTAGKPTIAKIARVGLIAKGIVYVLLGVLGFMAAFEIGGQSSDDTNKAGVLGSIKEFPGGVLALALLAAGLFCYSIWRGVQTFTNNNADEKKWSKKLRYFFSGLIYLSFAFTAIQMIFREHAGKEDKNQYWASQLLNHSYGQVLIGLAAIILAAIGIYQIYYGFSEKYRKHVQELNLHSRGSTLMLRSGKVGYISRGIVWLVIAYLLLRAALHNNSSEAGGTGKAFDFIEHSSFGSYLLAALGIGLIAYGAFNFIRARYETFK
jgi:hypothetical protein